MLFWRIACLAVHIETINLVIELRKRNPAYFLCIFTNDSIEPYKDKLSFWKTLIW